MSLWPEDDFDCNVEFQCVAGQLDPANEVVLGLGVHIRVLYRLADAKRASYIH